MTTFKDYVVLFAPFVIPAGLVVGAWRAPQIIATAIGAVLVFDVLLVAFFVFSRRVYRHHVRRRDQRLARQRMWS